MVQSEYDTRKIRDMFLLIKKAFTLYANVPVCTLKNTPYNILPVKYNKLKGTKYNYFTYPGKRNLENLNPKQAVLSTFFEKRMHLYCRNENVFSTLHDINFMNTI